MAATELVPVGTAMTTSPEFTVTGLLGVALKGDLTDAAFILQMKDDQAAWHNAGVILHTFQPAAVINYPGTYRLSRFGGAAGVFKW